MTELAITASLLGVFLAAAIILAVLLKDARSELSMACDNYRRMEHTYDEKIVARGHRIAALEADLKKLHAVHSATCEEKLESQDALRKATETVWDIKGTLEKSALTNQRLYDLIVTTVNGDAQAARKASEDAVERFLKVADAAERRAGDVICEATTIIGGPVDGEEECECCREKRRQDRQGLGGRPAPQPGDAGGLLRDGGQGTWWRPGVRQPSGEAHPVHHHRPGGAPAANPVDGADDDAH